MDDVEHRLFLRPYPGQTSSFYNAECSCGWVSSDQRDPAIARREWGDHAEGIIPAWLMRPGERRVWDGAGRTRSADLPVEGE